MFNLTTEARVREYVDYDGEYTVGASTFLGKLITLYSYAAAKYLNREVSAATHTEYFDVDGNNVFVLKGATVSAISAVYVSAARDWDNETAEDSDNYTYDPTAGIIYLDGISLPQGFRTVKVVYVGGMATNTTTFIAAYPDIAEAMDEQVAYHYDRRNDLGTTTIALDTTSRSYRGAMNWLASVRDILDSHMRYSF